MQLLEPQKLPGREMNHRPAPSSILGPTHFPSTLFPPLLSSLFFHFPSSLLSFYSLLSCINSLFPDLQPWRGHAPSSECPRLKSLPNGPCAQPNWTLIQT